jgi:hypothetical protein
MSRIRQRLVMTTTILGSAGIAFAMRWPAWTAILLGPAIFAVGTLLARRVPARKPDRPIEAEPGDLRLIRRR